MPVSSQAPRAQEKLEIILGQVTSLRSRLNWLALQHGLYLLLAIGISATALVMAAATMLSPLLFLLVVAAVAVGGLASLWFSLRSAWRRRANAAAAAALADERAGLKGRITTIVQTASQRHRGMLWAYLVEDALEHRDAYLPAQIERRRIARSWWAPVAAMIFAAALIPLVHFRDHLKVASNAAQPDITVDLNDLHLREAEPGDADGLQVQADPATMERLREKLAREGVAADRGDGGRLDGLLNRARNLADNMQRKLRGESNQKQRMTLKLADADPGLDPSNPQGTDAWRNNHRRGDQAGQFKRENNSSNDESLPPIDESRHEPRAQASSGQNPEGGQEMGGQGNSPGGDDGPTRQAQTDQQLRGDQSANSGLMHGIGADPDSLFGEASKSKMSAEGFEIAIEARPIDHGAKGAGQAYLPPKVHTPLNAHQQPDQPIARAAVPPDDRTTIQRVFER
jgi:hypothetical protein